MHSYDERPVNDRTNNVISREQGDEGKKGDGGGSGGRGEGGGGGREGGGGRGRANS